MDSGQLSEKQTRRRSRTVSWDHSVRTDGDQPLVCRTTTTDRGVLWPQVRRFDRKRYIIRQILHCHSLWRYDITVRKYGHPFYQTGSYSVVARFIFALSMWVVDG
ncbi:hypothetical protein QTP88_025965 [Uroleucon formosanum]